MSSASTATRARFRPVDLTAYRIIEATLAAADPRGARAVTVTVRFSDGGVEVDIAGGGLDLSPQLRLTVSERARLCHGTVLPAPPGDRVPRLQVRLPGTSSSARRPSKPTSPAS